jgi:hypothetical protein
MTANGGPLPPRDRDSDQLLVALQPGYILSKSQLAHLNCRHTYVTSDGHCHYCDADCTEAIAAAVTALNANIEQALRL